MIARARFIIALSAAILLAGSVQAAGPRSGADMVHSCSGCHSAGGSMPSLAGMDKRYLVKSMKDFANGVRPSTIMGAMARGYSEQEIAAIASFFSGQQWKQASAKIDPKLAAQGAKLHERLCASCHGPGGRTNTGGTPRLAGQWPQYLYNQLRDQQGPQQPLIMRQRVQKLSEVELHALANYYASQK